MFWMRVHNVYLQIASEIGLLGMIVFILLLIKLLRTVRHIQVRFKATPSGRELVRLAAASEASLLAFALAGLFHPIAFHFYFYYIAGFALALKAIASSQEHGRWALG